MSCWQRVSWLSAMPTKSKSTCEATQRCGCGLWNFSNMQIRMAHAVQHRIIVLNDPSKKESRSANSSNWNIQDHKLHALNESGLQHIATAHACKNTKQHPKNNAPLQRLTNLISASKQIIPSHSRAAPTSTPWHGFKLASAGHAIEASSTEDGAHGGST